MKKLSIILSVAILLAGCNQTKSSIENPLEEEITVTADESLQPIVDAQVMAYNAHYPSAKINIRYVPEQKALNLMLNDSSDIAIVTREFNKEEKAFFLKGKFENLPAKMALDGVALIANKQSSLKNINLEQIKELLEGKSSRSIKLVFDNSSSSNLNVLIEKLKITNLAKDNIFAANGNNDVVEYIKKNTNAIGVIGNTWISDTDSKKAKRIIESVTLLEVSENGKDFYAPNLKNLKARKYPLERKIILHTKKHYGTSKGFIRFCCAQVGQLVVEKAGLLPYYIYSKEIVVDQAPINITKEKEDK